jgi:hypothetical protein
MNKIYIISIEFDNVRLQDHPELIELPNVEIRLVKALTPASLGCLAKEPEHLHGFYPQAISCVEFAISRSHESARALALSENCEWAIFLEEDFISGEEIQNLNSYLGILDKLITDTPIGVHLFPEQFGILASCRRFPFLRVLAMPDFAVGYILNKAALIQCSNQLDFKKFEIADWPRYMRDLIWLAPKKSIVLHPDISENAGKSSTLTARVQRMDSLGFLTKIKNSRNYLLFVLFLGRLVNIQYGNSPISSERIRSIELNLPRFFFKYTLPRDLFSQLK